MVSKTKQSYLNRDIKYSYLNSGLFVIILILLAVGALTPFIVEQQLNNSSDTMMIGYIKTLLNQNEFYFLICLLIALFLSILLLMAGLVAKLNKKKTYHAILFGLLGLLFSFFALGSLMIIYIGLNLT